MISKIFIDPETRELLTKSGNELVSSKSSYSIIENKIADLVWPRKLPTEDLKAKLFYEGRALQYENTLHYTFYTHNLDETETRNSFIDKLKLKPNSKVLEIACGTGRDSILIAKRLSNGGELHMQDISLDMMKICFDKISVIDIEKSFSLSNAMYLPYPDNYFDAVYSFGALGEFSDQKKALQEMVRVTKTNGKVVVGDESVPEYLRQTTFYKILHKTNPMFEAKVPIEHLPLEARDVNLSYVLGNSFYLIDFVVGDGEPTGNFDFPIPGFRGGTYRTRYEGELEGITPATKSKLYQYLQNKGVSVHDWLEKTVLNALENDKK